MIVGAGASGLAAAKYYRDRFGPNSKILLLDQLPDFGGNSHRNEFHVPDGFRGGADVMTLRNGGTVNLDSIGAWNQPQGALMDIPGSYGQPAVNILGWAGVDFASASQWTNGGAAGIPGSFGLRTMLLFPGADFGGTDTVDAEPPPSRTRRPAGRRSWPGRRTGLRPRRDHPDPDRELRRHDGEGRPDDARPRRSSASRRMTYKQYLQYYSGLPDEAFHGEYWRGSGSLLGAGGQAVSASDCWVLGRPGFPSAIGLGDTERHRVPRHRADAAAGREVRQRARRAPGRTGTSRSSS